ncbi:MAG: phosphoribosylanthranilate isomerase [Gemmataceae bacterium]
MKLRIKICGITNEADARTAAALGANAIGLNFYPGTKRHVAEVMAGKILRVLPPFVEPVGLFVNEPLKNCRDRCLDLGIRVIQWHGDEHELFVVFPCTLIPAFSVHDRTDLERIQEYVDGAYDLGYLPQAVLIDAKAEGLYGGTGHTAPWQLLAGFDPGVPVILAGGLTPDNVAEAIRRVKPYGVDVASGVEQSPGLKDADKVKQFIDNARAAAAALP